MPESRGETGRPLSETVMEGAHRPAKLHRFRSRKYTLLKDKMHVLLK